MTSSPCHNIPCSQPPTDHLASALFPGRGVPGMHPWTAMPPPPSPHQATAARASGQQVLLRRAAMTPEQRHRRLQSILDAAIDIMASLDDNDDEGDGSLVEDQL